MGESVFVSHPTIALALAEPGGIQGPDSQRGHSSGLCTEVRFWFALDRQPQALNPTRCWAGFLAVLYGFLSDAILLPLFCSPLALWNRVNHRQELANLKL